MLRSWAPYVVAASVAVLPVGSLADDHFDRRPFSRVTHRAGHPPEVSVYAELRPALDPSQIIAVPLWSGFSLRLLPIRHVDVDHGVFACSVQLLPGADVQALRPIDRPAHGVAFGIANAAPGRVPSFSELSLLVTAWEESGRGGAPGPEPAAAGVP